MTETLCWEQRGCDEAMQQSCPHCQGEEACPARCHFAACNRRTHVVSKDLSLLLNPSRDYDRAVKEACRVCEFFLAHGPDISERNSDTKLTKHGGPSSRFIL